MNNNRIDKLTKKLLDQYNGQNDTTKPKWNEEYNYRLTEGDFNVIINMAEELTTLKKILRE